MIFKRDSLFSVVCYIRTQESNNYLFGTGIFILKEESIYLLTAEHVAVNTNDSTILAIGNSQSECIVVQLNNIINGNEWRSHQIADMSLIKLNINNDTAGLFQGRCYPYDHINHLELPASRDDELTVIGFPSGLGVQGKFSPLTFRSYAASAFLTLNRADNNQPSEFFCLENPSMGGYSGGPVFDLGYQIMGSVTTTKEKTILHGIVHGTISDQTGGKIALITPMYYLNDLI